jgi:predicted RNA-binding protein Jag
MHGGERRGVLVEIAEYTEDRFDTLIMLRQGAAQEVLRDIRRFSIPVSIEMFAR